MLDSVGAKLAVIFVIIVMVVLIVLGMNFDVFSIQSKDKSLDLYSIGEVMADPQKYIGQKVTVQGYYYQGDLPNGEGYVSSGFVQQPIIEGSLDNVEWMIVNISRSNTSLNESSLYDFTGTLVSQEDTGSSTVSVILSVEKIELV